MAHRLVVNISHGGYDVKVDRSTKWGNPFKIGRDGTRDEVIAKYREWVVKQPVLMSRINEIHGKVLGCWCAPEPCHAEVLVELSEADYIS